MKFHSLPSWMRWLLDIVGVAGLYYASGRLGQLMAIPPGNVTAVWPPSGIALAAVLLLGVRIWPGIWLGAFFGNIWAFFDSTNSVSVARSIGAGCSIGVGSTLQALFGAVMLRWFVGDRSPLDRAQDVFKFAATAVPMCLVSCTFGVTSLCLAGFVSWPAYGTTWWTWWLGDTVGVLVVAPLLLTWGKQPKIRSDLRWLAEVALLFALIVTAGWVLFGGWFHSELGNVPLAFTLFPLLVWAAFRLGQREVATAMVVVAGITIWGTTHGFGPFVRESLNEALLLLQTFVGVLGVTAMVTCAIVTERTGAEKALEKERDFASAVLETVSALVVVLDREGRIVRFNRACEEATGYASEEVEGRPLFDLFLIAEEVEPVRAVFQSLRAGHFPNQYENFWLTKEGGRRLIAWSNTALLDSSGMVEYVIATGIDVTERRQMEEALHREEELVKAVLDNIEAGIVACNEDGLLTLFNRATREFHGLPEEPLPPDEWARHYDLYLPDGKTPMKREDVPLFRALQGERVHNVEMMILPKGGIPRTLLASGQALLGPNGTKLGAVVAMHDITERKEAEEALRLDESRLEALVQLAQRQDAALSEITDFALEEGVRLTGSTVGYLAFMNEDETVLTMHSWSKTAMKECAVTDKPLVYPVETTGLWGEAVRQRKPIITNDYLAPNPLKRGIPEGHVAVSRHMNLPVFDGDRIVAVAGVGNKEKPYDESDVRQLSLLMNGMWRIVQRKRAEEQIRRQNTLLNAINEVFQKALVPETEAELARTCLSVAEELTGSKFGFIDEVNPDGRVDAIAISDPGWDACRMPRSDAVLLLKGLEIRGIWSGVIREGQSQIVNDPASHPDRVGTPGGHPPITSFLGVPLKHANRTIGLIGLANKEPRYDVADQQAIETLSVAFVEALMRKRAEEELRKHRDHLEDSVAERTTELRRSNDILQEEVAERKRVEHVLEQERNLLRTLIDNLPDYIFVKDTESRFVSNNTAHVRILGAATPEEAVGKTDFDFFPRELAAQYYADEQAVVRSGQPLLDRVEIVADRQGRRQWLLTTKVPLRDSNGSVVGLVGISRDITALRQAEEALAQRAEDLARSNTELEQFAYVTSHDLQEPLRKIQAFGDRLKAKCSETLSEEGRDYLERIQNATGRMQTLINDLLTFSRVTTEARPFVPVDLNEVAREVLADLEASLERTGGCVEIGELPILDADPMQMRQLLQNLIGNGLKFHREEAAPVVRLRGRVGEGESGRVPSRELCQLLVEDNGIGFDEKHLDRIFGMFQRLHGRLDYEGTGVGLALCRKIVERHRGSITARSAPGQGATFIVTLPVKQPRGDNAT